MSPNTLDFLRQTIEPVVVAQGFDLEDVTLTHGKSRSRVKVIVDADGGVDLESCAELSRKVSRALDVAKALDGEPYTLEVGSPGVSRPLTQLRHWARARGKLVRAVLVSGETVTGRVEAVHEETVSLNLGTTQRELRLSDIDQAKVQVEFRSAD